MTTRRTLVTAAAPIVLGLAVVAMLVVTWRAQERAEDATDAIARYRTANTELAATQRTLSASVAHLSDLLDQRQSIAAHAQCVEDRLLRTVRDSWRRVSDRRSRFPRFRSRRWCDRYSCRLRRTQCRFL